MSTLAERFAEAMAEAGMNQSDVARGAGVTPQAVQQILDGTTKSPKKILAYADALGVQPRWLESERGPKRAQGQLPGVPSPIAPNVRPAPAELEQALRGQPRDIPVQGKGAAGAQGDFSLNGEVIDYAIRPPGLAGRKGVFVIFVDGNSMSPWREPGDPVYLDEHRAARPGDYVLVECHGKDGEPGPAYLKRLVAIGPAKVRLAQHNPPDDRIEVAAKQVKRIYRAIPWQELMGV